MRATPAPRPPDGHYLLPDPDGALTPTRWQVTDRGRTIAPWPPSARYGPRKPPYDPDMAAEVRRVLMADWRERRAAYMARITQQLIDDPAGAAHAFVTHTGRCQACAATLTAADLEAPGPIELDASAQPLQELRQALRAGIDPRAALTLLAEVIAALAPQAPGTEPGLPGEVQRRAIENRDAGQNGSEGPAFEGGSNESGC